MLTAEIRWFFKQAPSFISLEQSLPFTRPSERTDYYLAGSGPKLGIKWREGKIQIKQQQGEAQLYQNEALLGEIEIWKKWSFGLENREEYPYELHTQHWIPVSKLRRLSRLEYDESRQSVHPLSTEKEANNICEVEITRVQSNDHEFFTLGLEASGCEDTLRMNLITAIEYLVSKDMHRGLKLSAGNSNNYARWLQSIIGNKSLNRPQNAGNKNQGR